MMVRLRAMYVQSMSVVSLRKGCDEFQSPDLTDEYRRE